MTLQVKEYIEKPLIVLYCIRGRMDKGLITKPSDIVEETGLTIGAVYHHINDLKKQNILHIMRENLKIINDIQITPASLKELHDQTMELWK